MLLEIALGLAIGGGIAAVSRYVDRKRTWLTSEAEVMGVIVRKDTDADMPGLLYEVVYSFSIDGVKFSGRDRFTPWTPGLIPSQGSRIRIYYASTNPERNSVSGERLTLSVFGLIVAAGLTVALGILFLFPSAD